MFDPQKITNIRLFFFEKFVRFPFQFSSVVRNLNHIFSWDREYFNLTTMKNYINFFRSDNFELEFFITALKVLVRKARIWTNSIVFCYFHSKESGSVRMNIMIKPFHVKYFDRNYLAVFWQKNVIQCASYLSMWQKGTSNCFQVMDCWEIADMNRTIVNDWSFSLELRQVTDTRTIRLKNVNYWIRSLYH